MLAASVRDYLVNYGVSVGDRTVVVTNNDDAYRTAIALAEAGLTVPAILDARVLPQDSALMARAKDLGIRVMMGHAVARVTGGKRVTGVEVCSQAGEGGRSGNLPLRRSGHVGRMVARGASVVPLRRQTDVGHGRCDVPP